MIPIYKPFFPPGSLDHALKAVKSTWVSSIGPYKELCSKYLQNFFGVKHVLLVNNGTSAVHLMSKALKFKHPKIKEIIVPNNVYVSAWNGFLYDGNYKLIPVDSDLSTWNIDLKKLYKRIEENRNRAFLAVHNLGNILPVHKILKDYPDLVVLEDNCEGLFGKYGDKYSGTLSLCSALSFFGNKTITCGEGGALVTNDTEVYNHIKLIHEQGQSDKRYIHNVMGYNYRMTNVQAALLYGQLGFIGRVIKLKQEVFRVYRKFFSNCDSINVQFSMEGTSHSNWMLGVKIDRNVDINIVRNELLERGIDTRPLFYPMSYHKHFRTMSGDEINSEILSKKCVILPSYPKLSKKDIIYICNSVVESVNKHATK